MTEVELAAIVRDHTARAITAALAPVLEAKAALELRLLELETRPAVIGPAGEKGADGLPGAGVASLLLSADGRLMAHLSDGRTLDAGPVPRGLPGAKGLDGLPGAHGRDADATLVLDLKSGLERLQAVVTSLPVPGPAGPAGVSGADGKDGIGVMDAVLDRAGHLLLTLSDGRTKDVGLVTGRDSDPLEMKRLILEEVGKIPPPQHGTDGKDGADGMTLDDAELVSDDDGWKLRLSAGGRTKDFALPIPHDMGPWTAGVTYPVGSGVSWDGGYWIAKQMTNAEPGPGGTWRLAVRRGNRGKEGPAGKSVPVVVPPSNTPPLYHGK